MVESLDERYIRELREIDGHDVSDHTCSRLHGMTASGVTIRTDRKRNRRYIELKLYRVLPLPEPEEQESPKAA